MCTGPNLNKFVGLVRIKCNGVLVIPSKGASLHVYLAMVKATKYVGIGGLTPNCVVVKPVVLQVHKLALYSI